MTATSDSGANLQQHPSPPTMTPASGALLHSPTDAAPGAMAPVVETQLEMDILTPALAQVLAPMTSPDTSIASVLAAAHALSAETAAALLTAEVAPQLKAQAASKTTSPNAPPKSLLAANEMSSESTQRPSHEASHEMTAAEELEMIQTMQAGFADPHLEAGNDLMSSLESIPNKMAFKIGEAAEMVGVKQYVLRYWESEFEMLHPRKSKNNQRVYSRKDVETALMIKKLLYQDRFSIEGARTALRQLKSQVKEERGMKQIVQSQETAVVKLKGLLTEIRRVREIFC